MPSHTMADDSKLQRLDSDLPAQPEALVKLSLLLRRTGAVRRARIAAANRRMDTAVVLKARRG